MAVEGPTRTALRKLAQEKFLVTSAVNAAASFLEKNAKSFLKNQAIDFLSIFKYF